MLKSRREIPPISNPRPTSPLPPRRSHDSRSDSPAPFTDSERRRSNSDGTAPTPRPAPRPLVPHVPSPVFEKGISPSTSSTSDPRLRPSPLQQPRSGGSSVNGSGSLFLTHSIGMSRSQGGVAREPAPSVVSASSSSMNAARTSPVKGRGVYDAKLMVREMDRLGLSSGAPSANVSSLSLPLSNPTLPTMTSGASAATADTAPYQQLHVHVLPLFNSENLKAPIEELNALVKQHIQAVISRAPARALAVLEQDVRELVNTGMMTLNGKLAGLEEETLLTRVVQVWGQFWEQILPYLEGVSCKIHYHFIAPNTRRTQVFLPLQTDKVLQGLSRNPKSMRPGSPGSPSHEISGVIPLVGCLTIDVRNVVLQSFRDAIIAPIWPKLYEQFLCMGKDVEAGIALGDRYSRLQQMRVPLAS
ncbi:HbrB domain protein [Ceratobasidium sp. AG-Ba]|nr:HbrB domain protein [Ceratobasidium sp. AG-Ba]